MVGNDQEHRVMSADDGGGPTANGAHDTPHAYVGPWQPDPEGGEFWHEPCGASGSITDLPTAEAMVDFFDTGRSLAGG